MFRWVSVSWSLRCKLVEFPAIMYLACSLNWLEKINARLLFWVIKPLLLVDLIVKTYSSLWFEREAHDYFSFWTFPMFEFRDFEEVLKKKNEHTWQRFQTHRKRRTNVHEKVFNAKKKCSRCCYNAYLLRQTSRRVLLAAGFRLNQIVSWFLSAMILYFPRSLKSLPRKLHQQRRTIHHAKIDQRKKPFLLNTSCYRQITLQALVGKRAPTKLFAQWLTREA